LAKYFEESSQGIIPALYLLKRGLDSLDSADDKVMLFNAKDPTGHETFIDDRLLRTHDIMTMNNDIIKEASQKMDKLSFHEPSFTISREEFIHDEPRSRQASWGFVDDLRNSWKSKPTLLQHILTHPGLFSDFAYQCPQGGIVWKPGACYKYMREVYELQMDLLVPTLSTIGGIPRGTELCSHLLRNISGGSIRNVFVLFGLFIMRGSYNKTSHSTHRDKSMARVPLLELGRLWIRFLAYVRPLFEEWQYVFRRHMHANAVHYFLVGLDRPLTTVDISIKLSRTMYQKIGIKLSLGRYRQYVSFLVSCNQRLFSKASIVTTATDDQLGHTGEMDSGHYRGDARLPDNLDSGIFMSTCRASGTFQMLLGHPPDVLVALAVGREQQNKILETIEAINSGRYVPRGQEVFEGMTGIWRGPSMAVTSSAIVDGIRREILPELILHQNRSAAKAHAAVLDVVLPDRVYARSNPVPRTVTRETHPYFLKRLREFFGDDEEKLGFRSPIQAEVTQLMYDGDCHLLYVAPTGEGKTFPGLICSMMDQTRSTVWILPLRSMHEQYLVRCQKNRLSCRTWSPEMSKVAPPLHILVAVESVDSPVFHLYIEKLVSDRRLARIVVDEAHLTLTHDSFRPVMNTLGWAGKQSIQIVLQSATVPPSLETELFQKFDIDIYRVCRTETCRPNISYNVFRSYSVSAKVDDLVRKILSESPVDKVLIYSRSKMEAMATGQRLHIPHCHGEMDQEEIDAVLTQLREGTVRAVACTTVLGAALDIPGIKYVIHQDYPYDVISFSQESGRCGREQGTRGYSYVVIPFHGRNPNKSESHRFGGELIYDWANHPNLCRRLFIQHFNDGCGESCLYYCVASCFDL